MGTQNRYALILAGGRGTRFWPRSRRGAPKQLLRFLDENSLLRATLERLRPVVPPERVWVLTGERLRRQVIRELPEVPRRQIVAEPVARNTAPCLGLAAHLVRQIDENAVLGVFPADHLIADSARFLKLARAAYKGAGQGHLMVMGIEPRWPETGYGYIEFPAGTKAGALKPVPVLRFREKPDLKTAKRYLRTGRFYWNSGMFFWRADVFLDALRKHLPRTCSLVEQVPPVSSRAFTKRLRELFPQAENISVDYAVLEKASGVMGLPAGDIGWNDLGSWNAVYELLAEHKRANVARTDALLIASEGNYVEAPGKLVALLGVENFVVVDTPDALLVADRSRAQQVGDIVRLLEKLKRDDLL